eukprot:GEMP01117566.1.p1 GENE.GEMP01117566.1~~GEMP01117566.1.p1  ORF type:complete len:135 (+),score=24.84 GEMP01117566.1:62-466(+)
MLARVFQSRALGHSTRGPVMRDIPENYLQAKKFFKGGALTYGEFKQQCMSLRIFAFSGVVLGCCGSLIYDPPKSSYWLTWGPTHIPGKIIGLVSANKNEIFLTEKRETEGIPSMEAYLQLTLKRRLDSDVAEED